MKVLRRIAAAPFLVPGVLFALFGIFLTRISYIMIDGADPLGSNDNPVKCQDESPRACNTSTTAQFGSVIDRQKT
jgi:hypothetical protein